MYVGNYLYCDIFTLPSLIPSFLKKILIIKDPKCPSQIRMQYIVMENNRQTHEKYGHEFPPFKKITIVNGLGP